MKSSQEQSSRSSGRTRFLIVALLVLGCGGAIGAKWYWSQRHTASNLPGTVKAEQAPAEKSISSRSPQHESKVLASAAEAAVTTKRVLPFKPEPVRWHQATAAEKKQTQEARPTRRTSLVLLDLTKVPSEKDLRMAGQLGDELHPTRDAEPSKIQDPVARKKQEEDNMLFGEAIQKWNLHEYDDAVDLFRQHRNEFRDSPWAAESEMHIGCYCQYLGMYDESAFAFEWILANTQPGTDSYQKGLLRRGILYMDQGKFTESHQSFAKMLEIETNVTRKTYASSWIRQLSLYKGQQTVLRDCAQKSLGYICEVRGQKELGDEIRALPTPSEVGFKASELVNLATAKGMSVTALWADSGNMQELPVPFVAHYKDQHYVAVVRYSAENREVRLYDSRLGQETTLPLASFAQQWSGLAVVFDQAPTGSKVASVQDLDKVLGGCCGLPRYPGDLGDDGCGKGCGMPVWNVNMISMNFYISDVPMWHQPAYGPPVSIELSYNSQDSLVTIRPFGEKWALNYASYLMETPSGSVQIIQGDAKMAEFTVGAGSTYVPVAGVFMKLTKPAAYTFDLEDQAGNVYHYGVPPAMSSSASSLLLSITDRHGTSLTINHNSSGAITKISHEAVTGDWDFVYNGQGLVDRIEDPFGRIARFYYDVNELLVGQEDMGGLQYSYGYTTDPELLINSITTPSGTTEIFTEPADGVENGAVRYPARGEDMWDNYRITLTDPLGQREEFYYDGVSRKSWHRDKKHYRADVSSSKILDTVRTQHTHTLSQGKGIVSGGFTPAGNLPTYSNFNANRQPQTVTYPGNGGTHLYTYNAQGRVLTHRDSMSRTTTYEYEANGIDLKKITNAASVVELQLEYAAGTRNVSKATDGLGRETLFTYNARGQVQTITKTVSTGATPPTRTDVLTYDYNVDGQLEAIDLNGVVLRQFAYDAMNRMSALTDESGYTLLTEYDDLDRLVKTAYPDATFTLNDYSCCTLDRTVERDGRFTKYLHDPLKRLVGMVQPGNDRVAFAYDANDNLTSLHDGKGQITRWEYDDADRMVKKIHANGSFESYTYTILSQLATYTNRKGVTTTRTYNAMGNPMTLQTPGIPNVSFTYDTLHRLATLVDGSVTTTYTYDNGHRLIGLTTGQSNSALIYSYDEYDRLLSRNVGGSVYEAYRYDALGRLTEKSNVLGTFTATYDANSSRILSVVGVKSGNTVVQTHFEYFGNNDDYRLKQIKNVAGAGAGTLLSQFDYTYTPSRNFASWKKQLGASASPLTWKFGYDELDQLTAVETYDSSNVLQMAESHFYSYDQAGNRTSQQGGLALSSDTHNSINQLVSRNAGGWLRLTGEVNEPVKVQAGGSHSGANAIKVNGEPVLVNANGKFSTNLNLPTGSGNVTIEAKDINNNTTTQTWSVTSSAGTTFAQPCEYDANGNLTAKYQALSGGGTKVFRYEWDALDRLKTVTVGEESSPGVPVNGAQRTDWTYDAQSRRIKEADKLWQSGAWVTQRDVCILWDGLEIVQERDSSGNTVQVDYFVVGEHRRVGGGSGATYYYTRDHLGSLREMLDDGGALRSRYDYDPFGALSKIGGDLDVSTGYTGHRYHVSSGLHLALVRAYDADLGRWLSSDPIEEEGGINLYAYVGNGPMMAWDPIGQYKVNADGSVDEEWGSFFGDLTKAAGGGLAAWVDGVIPIIDPLAMAGAYDKCDPDFAFGNKMGELNRDIGLILIGQPLAGSKRFVTQGASKGTSHATKFFKKLFKGKEFKTTKTTYNRKPGSWKMRKTQTRDYGKFFGRWTPNVGGLMLVYDLADWAMGIDPFKGCD